MSPQFFTLNNIQNCPLEITLYILELFTLNIAEGTKLRIEEQNDDIKELRRKIFWAKIQGRIAGYKIYQHIKHENFLIESKWDLEGKKLWLESTGASD